MSSTFYLAPTANFTQKALNGSINDTVQTITLNNTTDMLAPGYIVVDRVDSSGVATASAREIISYTGISGNDLTGCTRGADGSTARSHNDLAIVETSPVIGMWNSLTTIVSQGFTGDGYLKAINSPVSIANLFSDFISLPRLAVTSLASVARIDIGVHLNASGASLSGNIMRTDIKTRVSLATAQLNLTDATFTKVLLDTETYDVGGNFASNTFTAPVDGYYSVHANVGYTQVIASKRYHAAVYKEAAIYSESHTSIGTDTSDLIVHHSDIIPLTATDTLELYARADVGANTVDLLTGAGNTFMTVHLISV